MSLVANGFLVFYIITFIYTVSVENSGGSILQRFADTVPVSLLIIAVLFGIGALIYSFIRSSGRLNFILSIISGLLALIWVGLIFYFIIGYTLGWIHIYLV